MAVKARGEESAIDKARKDQSMAHHFHQGDGEEGLRFCNVAVIGESTYLCTLQAE